MLRLLMPAATALLASAALATPSAFAPGERVQMDVHYLGMQVGEFQVSVSDIDVDGRAVWPLTMEGRTRGLFDGLFEGREHFISFFDPQSGLTLGNNENSRTKSDQTVQRVKFKGEEAHVSRTYNGKKTELVKKVPSNSQDILSAIYHLRTLPLGEGQSFSVPVFTGRKSWMLEGKVLGRRTIKTEAGTFDTWELSCRTHFENEMASQKDMKVFISADERRLPVRIEAEVKVGALKADLISYTSPQALAVR